MLANAFRPFFHQLRKVDPAFREQYEPANILDGCFAGKLVQIGLTPVHALLSKAAAPPSHGDLFAVNLAAQREQFQKLPSADELTERLQRMHSYVAELQARGSRCVFYEMPIDSSLRNSPRAVCIRERLLQAFPPGKFRWIFPEQIDYPTSDGAHLPPDEAVKYAHYLAGALRD